MSKDLNLCQFIGRLGSDPEIRATASGTVTATLSIACGDDYKDKQTGQKVDQTNWIRVVAFGRLAEIMRDYVKKGSQVYISGKQVTRKWQDQSGQDRYTTEINASNMQMLDSKGEGQAPQQQQAAPVQQAQSSQAAPMDDFDDDIPF